jgi:plastocyanin
MTPRNVILITFLCVAIFAFMAGCSSTPPAVTPTPTTSPTPTMTIAPPIGTPTIAITSPLDGAMIPAGNITVTIQAINFSIVDKQGQPSIPGQGHVHFYMDVSPIPTDPTKLAIPTNASAAWAHVSGNTYTFTNVPPGMHTFTVQLVNNDHTPVQPSAIAIVMVTVAGPTTTNPTTTLPTAIPTSTTMPSGSGQTVQLSLIAKNIAFDKSVLAVPAGATVMLTLDNQDSGVPHSFALYTNSAASTAIFRGDIITGPKTATYTFTAPSTPGNYFFRCDVHPTVMTGSFVVT